MSDYKYDYFKVSFPEPFVAHVEIDRADKLNAFFQPMWINMGTIFTRLSRDPDVRAIVLSGSGEKAFSAGLDLQRAASVLFEPDSSDSQSETESGSGDVGRNAVSKRRVVEDFQKCISTIAECEKPVIVAIHGHAIGLAIDIASACDIRLAASSSRLCVKEIDIGMAADIGTLSRLPKIVGSMSWVKDVCLTGREFGAEEAARVGFVSRVAGSKSEIVEIAVKMAKTMAEKSPIALVGTKHLIDYSVEHSVADGLKYTAVWNGSMLQSQDFVNAVMAGMSRKKVEFSKL